MVIKKSFLLLLIITNFHLFSQNDKINTELSKYSNFGFTFGGVLFDKAQIDFEQGTYPISSIPIPSFCFGFHYNLPIYGKWSIETGLLFVNEASLSIKYKFLEEDYFYLEQNEEVIFNTCEWFTPSIPFSVKYKIKIGVKSYLDFKMGMKMMLLVPSGNGLTNVMSMDTGYCSNLRISVSSPYDCFVIGSLISSIGYSLDLNKILLGFELSRTMNFHNTYSGGFRLYNLITNPDVYGYYNLSGNYWALNVNIHFLNKKYRKEHKS